MIHDAVSGFSQRPCQVWRGSDRSRRAARRGSVARSRAVNAGNVFSPAGCHTRPGKGKRPSPNAPVRGAQPRCILALTPFRLHCTTVPAMHAMHATTQQCQSGYAPEHGFAQERSLGQVSCWSEQAGASVRCPGETVMSTCLCSATPDVCAGYVAPTSHVLTCSWVSGPRPSAPKITEAGETNSPAHDGGNGVGGGRQPKMTSTTTPLPGLPPPSSDPFSSFQGAARRHEGLTRLYDQEFLLCKAPGRSWPPLGSSRPFPCGGHADSRRSSGPHGLLTQPQPESRTATRIRQPSVPGSWSCQRRQPLPPEPATVSLPCFFLFLRPIWGAEEQGSLVERRFRLPGLAESGAARLFRPSDFVRPSRPG
jgi:hypothetical protein